LVSHNVPATYFSCISRSEFTGSVYLVSVFDWLWRLGEHASVRSQSPSSVFRVRSWSRSDFTTESADLGLFSGLISDFLAALFLRFSSERAECNVSFLHFPNEDSFRCQQSRWSGSLLVRQGAASQSQWLDFWSISFFRLWIVAGSTVLFLSRRIKDSSICDSNHYFAMIFQTRITGVR
jgi:hypothetical protein